MKPRKDITLGEMQEECKRRRGFCNEKTDCDFRPICRGLHGQQYEWNAPQRWDMLTDPPRFTEAQMALLKAFFDTGGAIVRANRFSPSCYVIENLNGDSVGSIFERAGFNLEDGETLDLAELLGKDGAE